MLKLFEQSLSRLIEAALDDDDDENDDVDDNNNDENVADDHEKDNIRSHFE